MSDAYKSIKSRYLSSDEKRLLSALLLKARITKTVSWIDSIRIFPFDDGGMGSYYFLECHSLQVASDILFLDSDGICVLATLYVNNNYGAPAAWNGTAACTAIRRSPVRLSSAQS